jgi:alpha-tubulin suppressor-like RCC1 family protein
MGMAQEGLNAPIACFARGLALECQHLADLGSPSSLASPAPGPVPASELGKVVQIGMNDLAACALDDHGLVACWGGNRDGRLGRPDVDYVDEPTRVPNLPKATQVALGPGFSCALTTNGEVWCWGHEDEHPGGNPRIEQVPGLERVRRIFAFESYACAENVAGEVRCFTGIESAEHQRVPSRVPALDGTRAVVIKVESAKRKRVPSRVPSLDGMRPAVIPSGPHGWVAAAGRQGELLLGTIPGPDSLDGLTLAPVPELSGIQRAVAYFDYLVALDANGKVFVGRVEKGKLTTKMKHVRALDGAVDVAFGMFLFRGGQIRSWADANPEKTSVYLERSDVVSLPGDGSCGQTAAGDLVYLPISGDKFSAGKVLLRSMKSTSGDGELHVCGVDAKGEVFCRGTNHLAQCGVRIGFESSATPLTVMLP